MKENFPFTEKRPWGEFRQFTAGEPSTVKILYLKAGESLSLQKHAKRTEFWHILSGRAEITVGEKIEELNSGSEVVIEPFVEHRARATNEDVKILEVSFGEFAEHDEVRLADYYGRK